MSDVIEKSVTIPLTGDASPKAVQGVTVPLPGGATLLVSPLTEDGDIMFGTICGSTWLDYRHPAVR